MNPFHRISLMQKLAPMSAASVALMAGIITAVIFDVPVGTSLEAAHLREITAPCVREDSPWRNADAVSIGPASPERAPRVVWTGEGAAVANATLDRVRDVADERKTGRGSRSL
jgi:hypothetical protein